MATRINGKTFRSGCDISNIMASINGMERDDTPAAREVRIALYAARQENGRDLWTDEALDNGHDAHFPECDEFTHDGELALIEGDVQSDYFG